METVANYIAQVEQLPVVQVLQALPPTGAVTPFESVKKQAKVDNTRSASPSHWGQQAVSSDWLTGRNFSNFESHS